MLPTSQKVVELRRDVRHHVAMRAQVTVSSLHVSVVRLASAAGAKDGWVEADAVDFSLGGVGLITQVFFPRHAVLRIRLLAPGEEQKVLFEGDSVVRRVIMTDRRPAYHIGTSFHSLDAEAQKQIAFLNALLSEGE
ncbi:MAG TPA: PilZ domain-containing protein [Phycisphaerales bacterium]|nr:PilZ domain-containing protein [Phycisphaerales bacterium]